LRILSGNADDVLRYLRSGDVDVVIGLLRSPDSTELVHDVLAETPYVVVGRRDHRLARRNQVTLEELAEYDWVIGTPGASRRTQFDTMFAGRTRPHAQIATCSLPIIRLVLAQSNRLTLLTSYELMYEDDALAAVPFGPIEPAGNCFSAMRFRASSKLIRESTCAVGLP